MNAKNMREKTWLHWVLIVVAGIGVFAVVWISSDESVKLNVAEEGLLQLAMLTLGSVGTFFQGQSRREQQFRNHAKERYRRLCTLGEMLGDVVSELQKIESKPRLIESQKIGDKLSDYRLAARAIESTATNGIRHIRDCLRFWNDFAPDEVGTMHRAILGEEYEE